MERSYARVKKALDKKTSKNEELNLQMKALQQEHIKVISQIAVACAIFCPYYYSSVSSSKNLRKWDLPHRYHKRN